MEQKGYRLASCNIEGDKNLVTVKDFLMAYTPDVVCFQEAPEDDTVRIARELNYNWAFRANVAIKKTLLPHIKADKVLGLAILSRNEISRNGHLTYRGDPNNLPLYQPGQRNSPRRELLHVSLPDLTVATTHFTWAPEGQVSDDQREDIKVLIAKAKMLGELVLAGDFNSPRPNEIYQELASHFRDNIPPEYTTSIDPEIHRAGNRLQLLVDYIFSTPGYEITNVHFIEGVSDHKALVADVSRRKESQ